MRFKTNVNQQQQKRCFFSANLSERNASMLWKLNAYYQKRLHIGLKTNKQKNSFKCFDEIDICIIEQIFGVLCKIGYAVTGIYRVSIWRKTYNYWLTYTMKIPFESMPAVDHYFQWKCAESNKKKVGYRI